MCTRKLSTQRWSGYRVGHFELALGRLIGVPVYCGLDNLIEYLLPPFWQSSSFLALHGKKRLVLRELTLPADNINQTCSPYVLFDST